MKKLICLVLLLCMVYSAGAEETVQESKPQYIATAHREVSLYADGEKTRRLAKVPQGESLSVLAYAEDWCLAEYEGITGYCATDHLYRFVSQQPEAYRVPGYREIIGFIGFTDEVFIAADAFEGIATRPGQLACVAEVTAEGYVLPVWRGEMTVPREQAAFYPFVDWQQAQPGDVIGGFTTLYGEQQGKDKPLQREHNIQHGCDLIHETVLKPDGVFSFNELCAPYKKSNGYQYAPNISQEGYGYGGGVCQVTTTLYNAVLTLPLQVLEWYEHRYTGVQYVPQFFDAAVGSYTDFVFQNTLPYSIRILAVTQEGVLTVLICRE